MLVGAALVHAPARADGGAEGFVYRTEWRKFGPVDYAATSVVLAAVVTLELTQPGPTEPVWTSPAPYIDEPMRNALAAPTRDSRTQAANISNWFWYASIAYPVVDVVATPKLRGATFLPTWQMTMMNVQALATAAMLVRIPQKWVGRTRPTVLGCERDIEYSSQCDDSIRFVSFPGGHYAAAMTGAGLTCAHHLHGELYGGGAADALVCGCALTVATVGGYLRLRADEHWLSDQLVGGTLGIFSGYVLPTVLYYRPFWRDSSEQRDEREASPGRDLHWTVAPSLTPNALGLSLLWNGSI